MRQGDSVYLRHVMDAIFRIEQYTDDMTYDWCAGWAASAMSI